MYFKTSQAQTQYPCSNDLLTVAICVKVHIAQEEKGRKQKQGSSREEKRAEPATSARTRWFIRVLLDLLYRLTQSDARCPSMAAWCYDEKASSFSVLKTSEQEGPVRDLSWGRRPRKLPQSHLWAWTGLVLLGLDRTLAKWKSSTCNMGVTLEVFVQRGLPETWL